MIHPSEEATLLHALDMVLFERMPDRSVVLTGRAPGWFERICPPPRSGQYRTELTAAAPFLEQFLADAEEFWSSGSSGRLYSGPWVQRDMDGYDRSIEAWALYAGARQFLVLKLLGAEFEQSRQALQRIRDLNLSQELHAAKKTPTIRMAAFSGVWFTRGCLAVYCLAALTLFAIQASGPSSLQRGGGLMTWVGLTAVASILGLIWLARGTSGPGQ